MPALNSSARTCPVGMCALVFLFSGSVVLAQTTSSTTTTSTTTKTSTTPGSPADPDGGWPRSLTTASGATLILYQPQILSWNGQSQLDAMAALSYAPRGASQPMLGTVRLSSPTSVSMEERLVSFSNIQIAEIKFSTLSKEQSQEVAKEIQSTLPNAPLVMSLDRVLAAMDKSQITAKGVAGQDRSAADFLQQPACDPGPVRRRCDSESDRRHVAQVRGQHQLGRVPRHLFEPLLSAR